MGSHAYSSSAPKLAATCRQQQMVHPPPWPIAGATLELPAPEAASDILNEAMDATAQATQAVGAAPDPSLLQSAGGGTSTFSLPSAPDLRGLQESGGAALQGTRESLERAFQGLGETAGGAAAALKGLTGSAADAVQGLTGTVADAVQNLTGSTSDAVQGLAQGSSSAVTEEARLAAEQLAATRESLVGSVARYYDLLPPEAQSLLGAGENEIFLVKHAERCSCLGMPSAARPTLHDHARLSKAKIHSEEPCTSSNH